MNLISLPCRVFGRLRSTVAVIFRAADSPRLRWVAAAVLAAIFLAAAPAHAQTGAYVGQPLGAGLGAYYPSGFAVDGSGNLYMSDGVSGSLVEIPSGCTSSACVVTLIPGGFLFVAIDSAGNLYAANYTYPHGYIEFSVYKFAPGCTAVACASTVGGGYSFLAGLTVDTGGNVYVVDVDGGFTVATIKKIAPGCASATCVTTVATTDPSIAYLAVDGSGNLYTADGTGSVYEIPAGCSSSSCFIPLGGGFSYPNGVALDGYGNIYVPDAGVDVLYEMPAGCASAACVVPVAGGGVGSYIAGVGVDAHRNIYFGDQNLNMVEEVTQQAVALPATAVGATVTQTVTFTVYNSITLGTPVVLTQGATGQDFTDAGTGTCDTNGPSYLYAQNNPETCTVNVKFTPQTAGQRLGVVQLVDNSGNVLAAAHLTGTGSGPQLAFQNQTSIPIGSGVSGNASPTGIAVDTSGNVFYTDYGAGLVQKIVASGGGVSGSSSVQTLASGISSACGVAVDGQGDVFANSASGGYVIEIPFSGSSYGTPVTLASGYNNTCGITLDAAGNVYFAEQGAGTVREILAVNGVVPANSSTVLLASGLDQPQGLAVDGNGNIYVANFSGSVVMLPYSAGTYGSPVTVGPSLGTIWGLALDPYGNLFVSTGGSVGITEMLAVNGSIPANPTVLTVGSGYGDARSVAIDAAGNLYVDDFDNARISYLDRHDAPSFTFASTAVGATSSDSPQTLQVQNIGNASLDISNFTASTNFAIDHAATTCSTSTPLGVNGSCNVGVDFAPEAPGSPLTGTLTLTESNPSAQQTASLSGIATGVVFVPAALISPTPSATLTGSTATFTWTPGTNVTAWQIDIGVGPGDHRYGGGHPQYTTSFNATGLPTNGTTLYVRLYSRTGNAWQYNDYTYTAYTTPAAASTMISPVAGATLPGTTATFTWTPGGNVTGWQIDLGTSPGGHQYSGGSPQYTTSFNATGLPSDGSTIYVRLYSRINNAWQYEDYTYTAYTTPPVASTMISPVAGTTLAGSNATFTWTSGTGVTAWQIDLGTSPGGHQYSGGNPQYTTTFNATGLPTNGTTIYVRLYSRIENAWQYKDYTYTAGK